MKYNLSPQSQSQPQSQPQSYYSPPPPQSQPYHSSSSPPQQTLDVNMDQQRGEIKKGDEKKKEEGGILSSIKSFFVDDKEEEEKEEEKKESDEEMIDAVNLYLKSSQDTVIPQTIDHNELKRIDNVIENYKELIENHDILDEKFSKYKESQKLKNFKDTSLLNDKQDTIENLTSIIKKLERSLNTYKRNAEKKLIAQNELHLQEIKKIKNDNNNENRKIHKFMQDILNERIDNVNKVIKDLINETDEGKKLVKTRKKTKKKKRKKKK